MKKALIILLFPLQIWAQDINYAFFNTKPPDSLNTGKYYNIDYLAFFYNNEYTSGIERGYTHIGNSLDFNITYKTDQNTIFQAGGRYNKFFGADSSTLIPILRLILNFGNLKIIMGNTFANSNHLLLTQLLDSERNLSRLAEYGLELMYLKNNLNFQTWIDWRKFIFYGSAFPEHFNVGYNIQLKLLEHRNHTYWLNLQGIFDHIGGEIDTTYKMHTIFNQAVGFKYIYHNPITLKFSSYFLQYINVIGGKYPFNKGKGALFNFLLEYKWLRIYLGYWWADSYICPTGQMYFLSYNFYSSQIQQVRKIYMFQAGYNYTAKNVKLFTGFYVHLTDQKLNYGYFVMTRFIFSERFNKSRDIHAKLM